MATDWQSWDQFMGLSGDELRRLEEEAMSRAEAAEGNARGALARAESETMTTGKALQSTQSYGDYVAARTGLRAAQQRRPLNAMEAAGTRALGLKGPDMGASARLGAEEAAAGARGQSFYQRQQASMRQQGDEARAARQREASIRARQAAKGELDAAQRAALNVPGRRGVVEVYAGTRLAKTPEEERLRRAAAAYQSLPEVD